MKACGVEGTNQGPMSPDPSLFCAPWEVKNIHRITYITNMIAEVALKGRIRMEPSDYIEQNTT